MSTSISPTAASSCRVSTIATTRRRARSSPPVSRDATSFRSRHSTSSKAAAAFTASRNRNRNEKGHSRRDAIRLQLGQTGECRKGQGSRARRGGKRRQRDSHPGIVRDTLFLPGPVGGPFRAGRALRGQQADPGNGGFGEIARRRSARQLLREGGSRALQLVGDDRRRRNGAGPLSQIAYSRRAWLPGEILLHAWRYRLQGLAHQVRRAGSWNLLGPVVSRERALHGADGSGSLVLSHGDWKRAAACAASG